MDQVLKELQEIKKILDNVVTKDDTKNFVTKDDFKNNIDNLREETKQEFAQLRTVTLPKLRQDIQAEFTKVRTIDLPKLAEDIISDVTDVNTALLEEVDKQKADKVEVDFLDRRVTKIERKLAS